MGNKGKTLTFVPEVTDDYIKTERQKAKALRKTRWWQKRISSGRCYYCGKRFRPEELTMDHVVPLVRGGRSIKNNLVPACKECNRRKRYRLGFEFELEEGYKKE